MTEQELFEAFYSVIAHGNGKQIADFLNKQLQMAKKNKDDLIFLHTALNKYRHCDMIYEEKEIFEHVIGIGGEELQKM